MTIDKVISKTFYKQFINNDNINIDDILKLYVFEKYLGNFYMNANEYDKYKLIKFKYLLKNKISELGNTNNDYNKRFSKHLFDYSIIISKKNIVHNYLAISIQRFDKIDSKYNINNNIIIDEKLINIYDNKFIDRAQKNVKYTNNIEENDYYNLNDDYYDEDEDEDEDNIYDGISDLYDKNHDEDEINTNYSYDDNFIDDYNIDDDNRYYSDDDDYVDSSENDNDTFDNYFQ